MDASDIIRMRNANAQYCYLKKNVLDKQPNCYSDSCLNLIGCAPVQYNSYAQKYLLKEGAKDMASPPVIPTYDSKLGFYVLAAYTGYANYQYRFYDGWGPLIDSGVPTNTYSIYGSYTGEGFQYAHFYDNNDNVILQILDSTGIIINTISYTCTSGPANYYAGERYGFLWYRNTSDVYVYSLIDPLHNVVNTIYLSYEGFLGPITLTNNGCTFSTYNDGYYYLYVWTSGMKKPNQVLTHVWDYYDYAPSIPDVKHYANVVISAGQRS